MADVLEILEPGPLTTIQDRGRVGYQRFGISASGALDQSSMMIANALVGNDLGAAVIEMTLAGVTLRVNSSPLAFAYIGAEASVTVDGKLVPSYRSFEAGVGAVVAIGPMRSGLRGYLAVAGGIACEPVQGSRSTHTRSGIGGFKGRALRREDAIPVAPPAERQPTRIMADPSLLADSGPVRVVLGPQDNMFSAEGIRTFLESDYRLSSKVDRMGCQLEGPVVSHLADFNIVSDGIANGSIQVPGNGQPIILLADRQSTGGYAKIATIISPDLRKVAQARPGDALRFIAISPDEAEHIVRHEAGRLSACLSSIDEFEELGDQLAPEELWTVDLLGGVGPSSTAKASR